MSFYHFTCCIRENNFEEVKKLIKEGFNIHMRCNRGKTPLFSASNNLKITKYLILHCANVNIISYDGETALINASFDKNIKVCKYLIKSGALIKSASVLTLVN